MSQSRVVIEHISPQIDAGLFSVKTIVGETLRVTADVLCDGHDVLAAHLEYKHETEGIWQAVPMQPTGNDAWAASLRTTKHGMYTYRVLAWVDYALNWHYGIGKKIGVGEMVGSELLDGVQYLEFLLPIVDKKEQTYLKTLQKTFADKTQYAQAIAEAASAQLKSLFVKYPQKKFVTTSPELKLWADREKARFSAWYEFFPRSASPTAGKHGTFKDCEKLLPRVAELGFDTLYLPPIHPIGEVNRKGKNNATQAAATDVGSCWGIGSKHGGHTSLHPELGTLTDFKKLVKKANSLGIEIAMDYALQAAPDHPWVKEHPQWFRWLPDSTVQYAENPPKKYQDILPIYFETSDWQNLWQELLKVALYWVEQGIKVFRVDNPHTKPFVFWEFLISEVQKLHPDVLFLAEAFTRPKIMAQLAKAGFTQSYTYYTWRNTKAEIIEYLTELTQTDSKHYFRPNFWANTPDILPFALQTPNEAVHLSRLFMSMTLSSNFGLYGPVYENMVCQPVLGKEEYHNSEKYEINHWDWTKENKITEVLKRTNAARKANAALQYTNNITFCEVENPNLIAYFKQSPDGVNSVLCVVNIDPYNKQGGWIKLPIEKLGIAPNQPFSLQMQDVIPNVTYQWDTQHGYVELHPSLPFHLFKITKI